MDADRVFVGAYLPAKQAAVLFQFLAMARRGPTLLRNVLSGGDGLPPDVAAQLPEGAAIPEEAAGPLVNFALTLDLCVYREISDAVLEDGRQSFQAELERVWAAGIKL